MTSARARPRRTPRSCTPGSTRRPARWRAAWWRRGSALLREYAERAGIAVERTGALLVAWTAEQAGSLDAIAGKSRANGYTRIRSVTAGELYEREPSLGPGAAGGLWIPDEWVIDPWSVPLAFATEAVRAGVAAAARHAGSPGCRPPAATGSSWPWLRAGRGEPVRCRFAVNAAGLASDEVDRMFGGGGFTIRPRKGELIVFDKLARPLLSLDHLAGAHRADQGGAGRARPCSATCCSGRPPRTSRDRSDTATSAAGLSALLAAGRRILPGPGAGGGDRDVRGAAGRDRALATTRSASPTGGTCASPGSGRPG